MTVVISVVSVLYVSSIGSSGPRTLFLRMWKTQAKKKQVASRMRTRVVVSRRPYLVISLRDCPISAPIDLNSVLVSWTVVDEATRSSTVRDERWTVSANWREMAAKLSVTWNKKQRIKKKKKKIPGIRVTSKIKRIWILVVF